MPIPFLRRKQVAVGGESKQRPTVPIHVVFQIKDFREASAGDLVLGPTAVAILRAGEILEATNYARTAGVAKGAEAHYSPSGLRSGAWSLAFEHWIVVSVAAFTPAAIGVLHAF